MFCTEYTFSAQQFPLATLFAVAGACALAFTFGAHAAVGEYECKTLRQDVGREEGDVSAPLLRRSDETLQVIEVGDLYYTSFDPVVDNLEWLELYGAQSQRGNSFIGFFQFEHFSCAK